VSQELDAVLPPDATGKLRDHLEACADCREHRADLLLGQRLLAVTEPRLPDNFAWKLQLKLNQTLQQSAGQTHYPWQEETTTDRWIWLRNFGAATAVGLAAVLALAMFLGPVDSGREGTRLAANASDRRPLFQPSSGGLYPSGAPQMVSTGSGSAAAGRGTYLDRGWSGSNTEDLITIRRLRVENQRLSNMLLQYQHANELMRARLDTSSVDALDLQHER
jgi:hypothetical protein